MVAPPTMFELDDAKLTVRSCYALRDLLVYPQNLNLEIQHVAHDQQNLGLNFAKPLPPIAASSMVLTCSHVHYELIIIA